MIPKIIHYCWFGHELMPKSQKDYIRGWKRLMPDYTFIRWDESNFNVCENKYTKLAYKEKKYAYVSDVARCIALLQFGGIYLDTDVELFSRFDKFLDCNLFTGLEVYREFEFTKNKYVNEEGSPLEKNCFVPWCGILSSLIGCEPNNELIKDCIEYYYKWENGDYVTIDGLLAMKAVRYGFQYKDEIQFLKSKMIIYPTGVFGFVGSINPSFDVSFHHNVGTWEKANWHRSKKREYLYDKMGLLNVFHFYKKVKRKIKKYLRLYCGYIDS